MLEEAFHRRVVQQIASELSEREKGAILLFDRDNIRYATGRTFDIIDQPAAACIWSNGTVACFVPRRDVDLFAATWIRDIRWYDEFPASEHPVRWMSREAGESLLVDDLDARAWQQISEESEGIELSDLVARLRAVKTPAEIDLIEQAADFADLAVQRAFARLTTGVRERELRDDVVESLYHELAHDYRGRYDLADPFVACRVVSGPRAAVPGALTSDRALARSDLVIVEAVVSVGGYHAQAGSCFFVGDPLRDLVDAVSAGTAAMTSVRESMRAGVRVESVHAESRRALERGGLGNAVRHPPGQGIGLAQREAPWLVRESDAELRTWMVIVNQPGAYFPGRAGVRHSETVLIEEDGTRVLNPRIRRWDDPDSRIKEF